MTTPTVHRSPPRSGRSPEVWIRFDLNHPYGIPFIPNNPTRQRFVNIGPALSNDPRVERVDIIENWPRACAVAPRDIGYTIVTVHAIVGMGRYGVPKGSGLSTKNHTCAFVTIAVEILGTSKEEKVRLIRRTPRGCLLEGFQVSV